MASYYCVPNCNHKGYSSLSGEKVFLFLTFLKRKAFVITERTKVCSLHFRPEDLRKSINGWIYVREDGIHSKFDWSGPSPKKRKTPIERQPLSAKKKLVTEEGPVNNQVQETVEMPACEPTTSFEFDTGVTPDLKRQIAEEDKRIADLE